MKTAWTTGRIPFENRGGLAWPRATRVQERSLFQNTLEP